MDTKRFTKRTNLQNNISQNDFLRCCWFMKELSGPGWWMCKRENLLSKCYLDPIIVHNAGEFFEEGQPCCHFTFRAEIEITVKWLRKMQISSNSLFVVFIWKYIINQSLSGSGIHFCSWRQRRILYSDRIDINVEVYEMRNNNSQARIVLQ